MTLEINFENLFIITTYYFSGTKEGHVKQKMPKKVGTIKPNPDEKSSPSKSTGKVIKST